MKPARIIKKEVRLERLLQKISAVWLEASKIGNDGLTEHDGVTVLDRALNALDRAEDFVRAAIEEVVPSKVTD